MSNHPPQGPGVGPPGGNLSMPPAPQTTGGAPPVNGMSSQNLNQIVLEYLNKKGYTRTEQILRQESANLDKDGRPIITRAEDVGNDKYKQAFNLVNGWIETNLDIYKFELARILWPMFIYSYLEMVEQGSSDSAKHYFKGLEATFERVHADELNTLELVTLSVHVHENSVAKLYRENKYRLPLNNNAYYNLVGFLESQSKQGGSVVLHILQTYCRVIETQRGPIDQYSFEAIINRAQGSDLAELGDVQEGIAGGFTGVTNQDVLNNNAPIKLGVQPMEPDLIADVRAELEEEDRKNAPDPGRLTLVDTFDQRIKREESTDALNRLDIPYPASKARDVAMEVQKIKEYRDRFKIEGRTGGIGPAVSICMFTFHNTMDTINCIEFSDDNNLVAVGTAESYIRVWHMHGEALTSAIPSGPNEPAPTSSRRLIGHSAPVYSVDFSPSSSAGSKSASATAPKLLLSCSADGAIRLWSLETWVCLVAYKGHSGPVWNVRWNPFGHYFVSCGWDKTVRVWSQDRISPVRMMVGHDSNVDEIAYHPNGAYVFSASDGVDKSVRMWSVTTGQCVRVFTGHTDVVSTMECSPDGKLLASGDRDGSIILWDLAKGTQIKRCKGHGKGGIWSLSFSVESTVLTSGGADGTVRIWDVYLPSDPYKNSDGDVIATGGQVDATRLNTGTDKAPVASAGGATTSAGGNKKKKEMVITADQISAFPTKKSPVYKVKFTRMNLVIAGGCFSP